MGRSVVKAVVKVAGSQSGWRQASEERKEAACPQPLPAAKRVLSESNPGTPRDRSRTRSRTSMEIVCTDPINVRGRVSGGRTNKYLYIYLHTQYFNTSIKY